MSLDPHHTHFILVDDGHTGPRFSRVADFRARFERRIAGFTGEENGADNQTDTVKLLPDDDQQLQTGVPVVVVLLEGGVDSIEFAVHCLFSL